MNHSGAVPEDGNETPTQWPRDSTNVNETRCLGVTKVQERLIDQIGDQDEFTLPEEASNPAHDEPKNAEVVEDEV